MANEHGTGNKATGNRGTKNSKTTLPKVKPITLDLVSEYANPWPNQEDVRRQVETRKWHPSTVDWEAVYGASKPRPVSTLENFLGAIKQAKPGSIQRINLWTHAARGAIGLSGSINSDSGNLSFVTQIDRSLGDEPIEQNALGTEARKLRDRFTSNARMFIYACNSGVDLELLDVLANTFQIEVGGLPAEVFTLVRYNKTGARVDLERGFTSMKNDIRTAKRGFSHLEGEFRFRKPRPDK